MYRYRAIAVVWALPISALAQPQFSGIGFLPGTSQSEANAVASDGSVVGMSGSFSTYLFFPVRWHPATGMQQVGSAIGAATGVSNDGAVVGWKMGPSQHFEAFRWSDQTGIEWLGYLQQWWPDSRAYAVSADGHTVVGRSSISNFHHRAFRWTSATGMEMLPNLSGILDPGPEALAISADGGIIVGYSYGAGARAVRWDHTGIHELGFLPGTSYVHSIAHGISADGQVIVGESVREPGWPAIEAFRWTAAQGMVGLGLIPGLEVTVARAVSSEGTIIGFAGSSWNSSERQAMIWTPAQGIRLLREELISQGTTGLDDWILREATAISASGQYIVGRGVNPQGATEGWIVDFGLPYCYANCDSSSTAPILNIDDFTCFINEFASALLLPPAQQVSSYANCDGSTMPPVLNTDDFTCFINAFAAGCP